MDRQEQALILSSIIKEHGLKFFKEKSVLLVAIINEDGDALVNSNIGLDKISNYVEYLLFCFKNNLNEIYDIQTQKVEPPSIEVPGNKEIN